MTGYGDDWGSYKPHPSLVNEWDACLKRYSQGNQHSDVAKLLMRVARPATAGGLGVPNDDKELAGTNTERFSQSQTIDEEHFSQSSLPLTQFKSQAFASLSENSEDHDVDSFVMEIREALESHNIPLPDDLVSSLSELPQQAFPRLLQRLQEELTSEGLQTLCELACEDLHASLQQSNSWLHPGLICKFVLLPKVMSGDECSNDICRVLEELARFCPKIVIGHILEPLLLNEESVNIQSELVKRVGHALPIEHHLHLIKFVLEQCTSPLAVPKIKVLIAVIEATSADLTVVMKKLMSLVEKSASSLADNEQFSNLLLIIIRRLPKNSPQPLKDVLANTVRQNKSFNKQILLDALKEKM